MQWESGFRKDSELAEQGDVTAGIELLDWFASVADDPEGIHPELIRHVARCLRRWQETGYVQKEARNAFLIKGAMNRPKDTGRIGERNQDALFAYCKARVAGMGHDQAKQYAMKIAGISESAMKHLYEESKELREWIILFEKRWGNRTCENP